MEVLPDGVGVDVAEGLGVLPLGEGEVGDEVVGGVVELVVDAVDVPVGEGLDLLEAGLVLQLLEAGLGGGLIGLVTEVDVAGLGGVLDLLLLPLAAGGDDVLGVGGDDLLGG